MSCDPTTYKVGTVIHKWTIKTAPIKIEGAWCVLAQCKCGTEVLLKIDDLYTGKLVSCGCEPQEPVTIPFSPNNRNKPLLPYGYTSHKWTIIDWDRVFINGNYHRLCKCECGEIKYVRETHLRTKLSKGCSKCSRNSKY